jgi:hypothetical protein
MLSHGRSLILSVALLAAVSGGARAETPADRRLRHIEEELEKAQQRIKDLEAEMKQQRAVGMATQRQVEQTDETAKTASANASKAFDIPEVLKKTTIFGDVRYRHEGFYHQPAAQGQDVTARNRERVRARLGVRVALSDEISATIRAATGNPNDPISTNETLTNDFTRKNFNLDWGYLTFTPGQSFGLRPGVFSVNAGKFPLTMFRTDELVFDDDVSPEGLNETFQLLGKPIGNLDQVKLHAFQWTFAEVANKQDGWTFGGQLNPTMHFGNVQVEGGLAQYWWLNPDLIAQALSRNTTAYTATGAPVANSNFNSSLVNTNLLVTERIQPPQLRPGTTPAAFNAITGYQSSFNETNLTLAATIPNVLGTQPLRLWGDYVYNWEAATDDAQGWQTGVKLGQTKVRGDWAVNAFYEQLEQEAVISSFTSSEFGTQGTNLEGPGIGIDYQLLNPLTISARSWFTNFMNRPANTSNPTLTRIQLDAVVKF